MFNPATEEFENDAKTMTTRQMADKYQVSVSTIRQCLSKRGLTRKVSARTDIKIEDVIADYKSGMTINEIRNKYGCSHDTITKRLASVGICNDRATGIKRHFAPTYEERWPDIKADLDLGYSIRHVRSKHKIRESNLKNLMRVHGYKCANLSCLARINEAIDACDRETIDARSKQRKLEYLSAIKEYITISGMLPTRKEFARAIGVAYCNVSNCINKYNLHTFFFVQGDSDYAKILKEDLRAKGIFFVENDRKILDGKEIDIWIPERNFGIEVDPAGTHSIDSNIGVTDRFYHQKKSLLASEKQIGLVHMYDEDFCDEKKYAKLLYLICTLPSVKTGARNCKLREVNRTTANTFLNLYHLQGEERASNIRYGLYYQDVLVSLITVGSSRFTDHQYEIIRYCVHPDYAVTGGFDRLLHAVATHMRSGEVLVSYMDLNKRFRTESVYEKSGFVRDGITPPDYVWVDSHGKTLKRYDTTKRKLVTQGYDANLSEKEIMLSRHFLRVFGAGSMQYVYKKETD